jgi:hypothetical protein
LIGMTALILRAERCSRIACAEHLNESWHRHLSRSKILIAPAAGFQATRSGSAAASWC